METASKKRGPMTPEAIQRRTETRRRNAELDRQRDEALVKQHPRYAEAEALAEKLRPIFGAEMVEVLPSRWAATALGGLACDPLVTFGVRQSGKCRKRVGAGGVMFCRPEEVGADSRWWADEDAIRLTASGIPESIVAELEAADPVFGAKLRRALAA